MIFTTPMTYLVAAVLKEHADEVAAVLLRLGDQVPTLDGEVIGNGTLEGLPNSLNSDYNGTLLYELFANFSDEGFIICSIVASTSNDLAVQQCYSAADLTDGTYIRLGEGDLQTDDIPFIVGELVEDYAVELDLKLYAILSHLNDSDEREYKVEVFTILVDDLPPEVDFWFYISEDLYYDEKYLNLFCDVKDVTGVPYVEIYYKLDDNTFWIIANASEIKKNEYHLSIPFSIFNEKISFQIYTKDWLGNDITTEIQQIELAIVSEYTTVFPGKRSRVGMIPEQSIILTIKGHTLEDSFIVFISEDLEETFELVILDLNESNIIESRSDCIYTSAPIPAGHVFKVQLISNNYATVSICNQFKEEIEFAKEETRTVDYDDVILLEIDNRSDERRSRSILADSRSVEMKIYVFNASNWELIVSGYHEVILPEERCYVLIYTLYHEGEIVISYNYEDLNEPFEHYYPTEDMSFIWSLIPLSLFALAYLYRRKRV